jgi:transcriptional regulator with XRE-family HTH domain
MLVACQQYPRRARFHGWDNGHSWDQLATAAAMMRSNISRIEAAKHRPTLETLEKIAKALKVSVADLIARR